MDDILGRVSAILAAVFIFMGIPMVHMQERAKSAEQMYLLALDTEFVDRVCSVGFLDEKMYEQFLNEVAAIPGVHQVNILHEQKEIVLEEGVYSYESTFYDEADIADALEKDGTYRFAKGDYVRVLLEKECSFLFMPWQKDKTVKVFYGGTVRYEDF